jgi:hypothetical protein
MRSKSRQPRGLAHRAFFIAELFAHSASGKGKISSLQRRD